MEPRVAFHEVAGCAEVLLRRLMGPHGRRWLEKLKTFLTEGGWKLPDAFVTVEIGTYRAWTKLLMHLEADRILMGSACRALLSQIELSTSKQSLDLVLIRASDLGLPENVSLSDIYQAAESQGLSLCPAEVGPQLSLQYSPRSEETLMVAMIPIPLFNGYHVFGVEEDSLWAEDIKWVEARLAERAKKDSTRVLAFVFVLPR